MLYAATLQPIPRREWKKERPEIWVRSLMENETSVKTHFTLAEVQYIGSTSGCGCDFSHALFQNGGWPEAGEIESDEEFELVSRANREALASLLGEVVGEIVELYGIWAGDEAKEPLIKEQISLDEIRDHGFRFKERGFYEVLLPRPQA